MISLFTSASEVVAETHFKHGSLSGEQVMQVRTNLRLQQLMGCVSRVVCISRLLISERCALGCS